MERAADVRCRARRGCDGCKRKPWCPPGVRKEHKAYLSKVDVVGHDRLKAAALAMSGNKWLTPFDLGCIVMRKSIRVSGNRIITRMLELGLVIGRPTGEVRGSHPVIEYRLSPEGEEVFGCGRT